MTAQIGDRLRWNRKTYSLLGELPLPSKAGLLEPHAEDTRHCTSACWRGYVASWGISRGKLYLLAIEGGYRLTATEPVLADWISDYPRIATGKLINYVHMEYASTYEGVMEFEILAGVVARHRTFSMPASGDDAPWVDARSSKGLFKYKVSGEVVQPLKSTVLPQADFRNLCARERTRRSLKPGEVARVIGRKPEFGGQLVEWERGEKGRGERALPAELLRKLMEFYDVSPEACEEMNRSEEVRRRQEYENWSSERITPVLAIDGSFFQQSVPGDPVIWAQRCIRAAWRPATLWLSRREGIQFDGRGEQMPREAAASKC